MNKRRSLIFILIVFLILGFASITTTLVINGVLNIGENTDDFKIIFTSAKLDGRKRNDFISEDKKHIEFISNELKEIDDETRLVYEVTNTSRNYDAEVHIECESGSNEYIQFQYSPYDMEVLAGETKTGTLKASMLKLVDEEREIPITCEIVAEAKERETLGDEYFEPFSKSGTIKATTVKRIDFFNYQQIGDFWEYKNNITKIVFENKLVPHETSEELIFDVSSIQDKSVMAYLVENGEQINISPAYTLYIQGETGVKANPNSSYLFSNFENLLSIEGFKYFDTSNVTNMRWMFSNCNKIEIIDLSDFDTSNVTDMHGMFLSGSGYSATKRALKTIEGLNELDTSNVKDMGRLFTGVLFENIDISSWDTRNVTSMLQMFSHCNNLKVNPASDFSFENVESVDGMFWACSSLEDVSFNYNGSTNLLTFNQMFFRCYSLKKVYINFKTNNMINCTSMFNSCQNLIDLDFMKDSLIKLSSAQAMFSGCNKIQKLNLANFNTESVKSFSSMFFGCKKLTELNITPFDFSNATTMETMFAECESLEYLDLSHLDTSSVRNFSKMFWHCDNLKVLNISTLDTSSATNMMGMFAYCENLELLDVSNFDTSNVTDMSSMFGYLRKVKNLDVSHFNTANVTTMRAMFVECNILESLDLSNFDTTKVTNMNSLFSGCHILNTIITIRGTNCISFTGENGYWAMFYNAATNGNIKVNYTSDASILVDEMIATKSEASKVFKGVEVV